MTITAPPSRPTSGPAVTQVEHRNQQAAQVERLLRLAAEETGARRTELIEQAVVEGVPMARTLAARYHRRGVDSDDLLQVASVGLVKAAHGYRPGPDTDFRSYAIPTIRGELRRHFRDQAWMVRPPRRIQDLQTAINAAEADLASTLQHWPTTEDLAAAIGVPVEDIVDAQRAQGCFRPASLDAKLTGAPALSLGTVIADKTNTYELVDHIETLRPVVEDLPARDRLILHRRFVDHRTQAEIGEEIGVSQMQVSRLLREILLTLRAALAA
ncbi:RNA polymerase, sigma 28 subunit, FliA/WhiG subfamily [Kribbella flavida DSM 17836]|uniref:RNA polymerase, sigma 28 subunit, FliA/WhiG subfamily n=1 Tax=Kribbella flavida (strain DSM 17836 / JCM 10339 / NBRC 14399) TaxID=479435 RepID=D2PTX6_KRIFD|nr:sigma-70 family RNA polymerase sigma factor [Kribbella flavida]ADB33259.1 RNA polymerase, sigma 28 subunit, FliA/WhiG subfamily [Kribbella flavida DSM 17836]